MAKNGEFKIEKGISAPHHGRGGRTKYPFAEMKVGDSFLASGAESSGFRSSVSAAAKRLGVTFTCSRVEDGMRVWRIK